jgi:hypothetical protein
MTRRCITLTSETLHERHVRHAVGGLNVYAGESGRRSARAGAPSLSWSFTGRQIIS